MIEIVLATKNPAKLEMYGKVLQRYNDLCVLSLVELDPKGLIVVDEPFNTAEENARHKAKEYSKALNRDVLAIDEAMYFDGWKDIDQPGVHSRRLFDKKTALTDKVVYDYWLNRMKEIGQEISGYWQRGYGFSTKEGKIKSSVNNWPFIFTPNPRGYHPNGWPASAFCIDPKTGKYFDDVVEDRKREFYDIVFMGISKVLEEWICLVKKE